MTSYAALWCKSCFSFLEGASHPDELVEAAREQGLDAIALTDRDGVYGVVRAHVKARELGFRLIVGSEITIDDGSTIVLLAQDRGGYANLCRLVTAGRLRSEKGASSVAWSEVCEHARDLIALWGGDRSLLVRAKDCDGVARLLAEAFGDRLYALAARHRRARESLEESRSRARAERHRLSVAAAVEVLYHSPARRRLQDVLTCIRHGVPLAEAGRRLKPNKEHDLKSPHAFASLFRDDCAAVARTREIASRCTFSLGDLVYRYPSESLPDGTTSSQRLRALVLEGGRKRYAGTIPKDVLRQLECELSLIDELDYCGYFLTMHEIVEFCRAQNIFCQGRGSAANSTVCYALGITAVDPVRMGLLFERFLSRERAEPPDIDLDIEHERREEVIQHVYAKYGRTHAAMVANVISYRGRSALRDVGKALGFSETVLARLANQLSHWEEVESDTFSNAGLGVDSSSVRLLCELANEIEGFPRHLSIHPGGFLLGHEPVSTLVPIENATMEARTVIQWDKDDVEALGLFKVDLLGLGALTHLHRCFDLVRAERGRDLSIATIPPDDEPTFEMIRKADTIGVFQIESRAQMSMLPRLRPKHYYDLVIEVSIVRPGPISGGMVHPYLRRRNGEEPVIYPHECLRPVLEKTLGVPLFQEQVMRLAVVAADYTPGEADQLRRDMAAWHKNGRIEQHRERLVTRMQKKGIAPEFAERVYQQILGFGEYGFPESHAASFAIISYAGAWLKRHYPTEFTCALLNAQPMGFYSIATIIDDAKRHGVVVRPIDVMHSRWDCTVEMEKDASAHDSRALRIGLRYVKSLGLALWEEIQRAAEEAPFTSLDDFQKRVHIPRNALESLAAAGAFESLEPSRRTSLWKAYGATSTHESPLYARELEKSPAFEALSELETITWDYESSSHSVRGHPLAPMRADLEALGLPDARTVAKMSNGDEASYAGLVICRQRPGTASGVTFMTLEDETGLVNLILKLPVFERYAVIAKTQNFLGVTGLVQAQDGVVHILVDELWKPETRWQPVQSKSRDFH